MEIPGFNRATVESQLMLVVFQTRAAKGVVTGYIARGIKASGSSPLNRPPNPFSATPTMTSG